MIEIKCSRQLTKFPQMANNLSDALCTLQRPVFMTKKLRIKLPYFLCPMDTTATVQESIRAMEILWSKLKNQYDE